MRIEHCSFPESASKSQREWVHERDSYVCQMPVLFVPNTSVTTSICGREGDEVHHIWPKRAMVYQNAGNPHTQDNLILLCRMHHHQIHPDLIEALLQRKQGNLLAIEELFEQRLHMLSIGLPYWNTSWDNLLRKIVQKRNIQFDYKYPKHKFPISRIMGQTKYAI